MIGLVLNIIVIGTENTAGAIEMLDVYQVTVQPFSATQLGTGTPKLHVP